jgi:hypothetical protein
MGYRISKYQICPGENEQLELTAKLQHEPRSIVHGIVKDCNDKPVKDAVVKLFEFSDPCNPCSLKPITHTFSDECGHFLFGPLMPYKKYIIKVWYDDVKIVPVIIKPFSCHDEPCDSHSAVYKEELFEEPER